MEHPIGTKAEVVARLAPQFSELLQLENLAPEDFMKPLSEWDEVPICTRLHRLEFLKGFPHETRSIVLLALALDFFERVIARASSLPAPRLSEFFVMINLLHWDDFHAGETVSPCFWVTTRASEELGPMKLVPPFTAEAQRVRRWLAELGCGSSYLVGEDPVVPPPEFPQRVHIGPVELPRAEMPTFKGLFDGRRPGE